MTPTANGPGEATAGEAKALRTEQPQRGAHAVHYRFSTSLFGRRFFMAILAGTETRSTRRLRDEGVVRSFWAIATELAIVCLALATMICLLTGFAVIALYFIKVAIGLDLMDGPSPLHPIYVFFFGN